MNGTSVWRTPGAQRRFDLNIENVVLDCERSVLVEEDSRRVAPSSLMTINFRLVAKVEWEVQAQVAVETACSWMGSGMLGSIRRA